MKKLISLSWIIFIGFRTILFSQPIPVPDNETDIHVFPSITNKIHQTEVHLSINKVNTQNIIVGANTFDEPNGTTHQGHYYTLDGGITWGGANILPNGGESMGDPTTCFDAGGKGFMGTLRTNLRGYLIQTTDDGGSTWSDQYIGVDKPRVQDKEMSTTVDQMNTSQYVNNFYTAWQDAPDGISPVIKQININQSTDGGITYDMPKAISPVTALAYGANVQTGPIGQVYVCWKENPEEDGLPQQAIGFTSSTDGGNTYASRTLPIPYSGIESISRSEFNGVRVNDFPSMAVDKSCGGNRGRIYIVYPDLDPLDNTRSIIEVIYLDDVPGASWVGPIPIPVPTGSDQNWFPWIAVDDQNGLVNVVYYSMDNDNGEFSTNTYVAYSTDGGSSWVNIQVSDESHILSPVDPNGSSYRDTYAGDYIGISSFGGVSYPAWHDNRDGVWQIYISPIHYDIPSLLSSDNSLEVSQKKITGKKIFRAFQGLRTTDQNTVTVQNDPGEEGESIIDFVSGESVLLQEGFTAENGAYFTAKIEEHQPCTTPGVVAFKRGGHTLSNTRALKINEQMDKVFCYPNPAGDFITIESIDPIHKFQSVYLKVTNLQGEVVVNRNIEVQGMNKVVEKIDLQSISPGVYLFSVIAGDLVYSGKFIKQNKP